MTTRKLLTSRSPSAILVSVCSLLFAPALHAAQLEFALVGSPVPRMKQIIAEYSFTLTLTISGAPGGPRDYVGLWRVADNVRVDWRYLDDTKDVAKHKAMQNGPQAGTVRFSEDCSVKPCRGLRPGNYAARLYRDGSTAQADMIGSVLVTVPRASLEMLVRASETRVDVERKLGAARDLITVTHWPDGRQEIIELDKEVTFNVLKAAPIAPAANQ